MDDERGIGRWVVAKLSGSPRVHPRHRPMSTLRNTLIQGILGYVIVEPTRRGLNDGHPSLSPRPAGSVWASKITTVASRALGACLLAGWMETGRGAR